MFANAVSRLTQKKHAQGELTRGEQGLLEANTHLLRQRVLQLHGLPFQPFQQLPITTTSSSHHMTVPLKKRPMLKQTAANVDSAASLQQPCPSAGGVPPRRRTKRMFDRACQHCGTRFTSQWRTGPSGPSTLCNACGIRYARQVKLDRARLQASPSHTPPTVAGDESPVTAASPPQSSPPPRASVHFLLN
ncbi:GATA zinc finger domain containing protein [Acanthamoeba castellanii str. Neff]|uniref:GATA zinc finger domain containing protein n=1 Tax=Acanthamoeba castellanii (strain ATCC 30010 / Neff) TaxID=1257118 RepID=L8GHE9_ACACF|nr:GATA zinc finger domain containing protein [Acanthamoeba castellanii str. Neff]ELR12163.1 GATA zinc finger domain containing protein [Acanthamoeba castellanii str. Neff]